MKVPTHLKHEPVFGIEGYNKMDGIYAGHGSDAPCLSIGIAQWNQRGSQDISAKVWRNSDVEANDYQDGSWSRMSEELPIHRNLDLTIFICEVMDMLKNEFINEDLKLLKTKLFNGEEGDYINDRPPAPQAVQRIA